MTDIQRHLKVIRKLLAAELDRTPTAQVIDLGTLYGQLRAFLPSGYGLTRGAIASETAQSASMQLVIYDVALAGTAASPPQIDSVLLVIDVSVTHSLASFAETLERISSVKALKGAEPLPAKRAAVRSPEQTRHTIPKHRLPYALMYFHHFEGQPEPDEALFTQLGALLSAYPHALRPDEIEIAGQHIRYFNPLLEHNAPNAADIGLSCVPDRVKPQMCYVCKQPYVRRHWFYASLCLRCGDYNYRKRSMSGDLNGYIALVTGARVKIGYETTLRLLRAGANVIATSRFPHDAARRFALAPDFAHWQQRLHVYGLDLRQIGRVEAFTAHLYSRFPHLDILVNNAAQTVKRPPTYYAHLIPFESTPPESLPDAVAALLGDAVLGESFLPIASFEQAETLLTSGTGEPYFPQGEYDLYGEQVDNRPVNSWVLPLDQVSAPELLEVHLVNAVAPALLAGQLRALLARSPRAVRAIINVSAAEGRFAANKQGYHPHTNMAKAALNMLTRSIADDYATSAIYVNSVDPGWVSDQTPRTDDPQRVTANMGLPIDLIDAAARICDPILTNLDAQPTIYGKLFKDYHEAAW